MAKNKRHPHYRPTTNTPDEPAETARIEPAPGITASLKPARLLSLPVVAEVGGLLLLPVIAIWAMRFVPINQNNYLDPYVYTGYIHNFKDLIARYGLTYYSVRFGMIVPAQAFSQLFGPVGGYFGFRYVLALIAGIPLYFMVKRHFSWAVAVVAVVGMLTSPYFARALLWDYPDASGVPFLIAAISLFLLEDRSSFVRDVLAGACSAMAVNSNFFEIALIGMFGVIWAFIYLLHRLPLEGLMRRVAGVALGGFLICVLGCLYYWHAFGRPINIFAPTLGMMSSLARGGAKQWRTAGIDWIATQIHVLTPVFLAICCIVVTPWRRITLTRLTVVCFSLAATAFYYIEQFLLGSDVLQLFYYFSYLMPTVFLTLAFLWQTLWERTRQSKLVFIGLGLAALLAQWMPALWAGWAMPNLTVSHWLSVAGVTILVVFIANRQWPWPTIQHGLTWLALVLLGACFSAGFADYSGLVRAAPATKKMEMDVYRVALQFMQVVPKYSEHPGGILFWYNNRVGNSINSIQSTFLWGFSKINANPPEDPGLPYLGDLQLRLLRNPQMRYLGLLGETEEELSQGLAALKRESVEFEMADHRVLASGDYRMYYQLIELKSFVATAPTGR